MALKRKKRLEKQLQQIDGTLSTIEFQREALENANTNTEVLKNMSYAAKALKSAHQQLWVYWKFTLWVKDVFIPFHVPDLNNNSSHCLPKVSWHLLVQFGV